jgi:tetratricopeptide (TPR) repeat protein
MTDSRKMVQERLDDSRFLAMSCEYVAALNSIDVIIGDYPDSLEALRLKGNVLEQKALDENERSPRRLAIGRDYLAALECYEQILRMDPRNTVALIDLGDHYKYVDAFHQAFKCYSDAIRLLEAGEERIGAEAELRELLDTCDELLRYPSARETAQLLMERCHALLEARRPPDGNVAANRSP